MANIFQEPMKTAPKQDNQIVRVGMEESQLAGRKDHMPRAAASVNSIQHVPNAGSKT